MTQSTDKLYCHQSKHPPFTEGFSCFQHTLGQQRRLLWFNEPTQILSTHNPDEVVAILDTVDQAVQAGSYAAGGISYEAASAFDRAFPTRNPSDQGTPPLAWFAIYSRMHMLRLPVLPNCDYDISKWSASISKEDYLAQVEQVLAYIAAGDCYQVNLTFPMTATFSGNAWPYFLRLIEAHRSRYGSLLHMGNTIHCSASPELFFERKGDHVMCRPMKGTCERGLTTEEDRAKAAWLEHSQKNRAENVMIVDMIRNDLGRVAKPGSIHVSRLFDVEPYPTVHQMTSTVEAQTDCTLSELFKALFPCASITGAPRKRCMEIIRELESTPRGMYTGCMGFMTPTGFSRFNVAIRTVSLNADSGQAVFGTGSGIVWDSDPEQEYKECHSKVRFLNSIIPDFQLLETLYGDGKTGYRLLEEHLQRMENSATYFSMPWKEKRIRAALTDALGANDNPTKFRLLLNRQGVVTVEKTVLADQERPWTVALAKKHISSTSPALYHKTTFRKLYDDHLKVQPDCDDVLLYNERMELTESCFANLALTLDRVRYTPPVRCGLLNGTFRQSLLDQDILTERVLYLDDLRKAEHIQLINSVRGWIDIEMKSSCVETKSPP